MKTQLTLVCCMLLAHNVYGKSFSCTPEHVTFASNAGDIPLVEKTTVTWQRIDYHIVGSSASAITYRNIDDPVEDINSLVKSSNPTDKLDVLSVSEEKVVMMGAKMETPMWLTVDVIFPKEGNGYSFYVSDYPKSIQPTTSGPVNLSKLYMLKCKEITSP